MIIWKGWGIANLGIVAIMEFFATLVQTAIYGGANRQLEWPYGLFLMLSGVIIWFLGKYLNRNADTILTNERTGQQYRLGCQNSLFFVPMQYWAFIFAGIGIYSFFV